jgi:Rrf2 family protein
LKLSKKGVYALRALRRLGDNHGRGLLSVADIARTEGLPKKYLEQVLGTLRKQGLLVSRQGKEGGYELRVPPEQITLGQILRAIDGPLAPIPCASRTAPHECSDCPDPFDRCWLRSVMLEVRDSISAVLDSRTLAQTIAEAKRPRKIKAS